MAATLQRSIQTAQVGEVNLSDFNIWEFDFDGWTLGEDALYISALNRSERNGDLRLVFSHWARMIKHWPYPGDPGNIKSYAKLDRAAQQDIIARIEQGLRLPKKADGRSGGGET